MKENWKLDKVEKLAGFTVAQMKEKLELKKQGKCTCAAKDTLCKTMCGTLLGPNAKDAIVGEKRGEFGSNAHKGGMPEPENPDAHKKHKKKSEP